MKLDLSDENNSYFAKIKGIEQRLKMNSSGIAAHSITIDLKLVPLK
jgi:hypothetical protein